MPIRDCREWRHVGKAPDRSIDDAEAYSLAELFDRVADADVYSIQIVASGKKTNGLPISKVSETLEVMRSRDKRSLRVER